jgi:hypothetical protein
MFVGIFFSMPSQILSPAKIFIFPPESACMVLIGVMFIELRIDKG